MADGVEIGTAYVSLLVSGQKVAPGVKQALGAAGPEADRAGKQAGKSYSASFGSVVKGTLGGLAAANLLSSAAGFAKGAISGASDLAEAGTKVQAIFGKGTNQVQAYAALGAKALGQTKLDVLDAASAFGTFGKAAGLSGGDLAKFSTKFAGLSTDLASFYNTSPEQAVEAIGAALRGEAEPIRQYGVLLDDATLRQEALRLGLIKTTKNALTPQQRVLAAQAAIYKQTTDAQGDFQRTSGGLANQQRILSATFKDTQAELGQRLLPLALDTTKALNKFVQQTQNGTGAGGKFADALGDIYSFGKGVVGVINGLPGPVKKFAVEAGIAYLVLSKFGPSLSGAFASTRTFTSGLANAETRMATVSKASYALGGALRQAGGVGGMLLLYNATKQTSQGLGTLEGAAGGALLGFNLGGPYGAAIGAGVGALGGLFTSTKRAGEQFKRSSDDSRAYAATLDQVSGAAKRATKDQILLDLTKNKTLQAGLSAGLTRRTLIDAALGDPKAIEAVRVALARLNTEAQKTKDAYRASGGRVAGVNDAQQAKRVGDLANKTRALNSLIGEQARSYADDAKNTRLDSAAKLSHRDLLKTFPKALVTKIETPGYKASRDQVASLARAYKLQPKQLVTLARLEGYDLSLKQAHNLLAGYKQIKGPVNAKANLDDKTARAQAASLRKVLDDLAKTRYIHYQIINPSTNKPKVGAGGQTGQRLGQDFSSAPASRSSQPLVAHLYDQRGELTASFRGLAEDTAYSVLKTEGY